MKPGGLFNDDVLITRSAFKSKTQTTDLYARALTKIEHEIAKIDFFRGVMRTEPAKEHEALWRLYFTVMEWHGPDPHWDQVCKTCRRANIDQLAMRVDFPCREADLIIKAVLGTTTAKESA